MAKLTSPPSPAVVVIGGGHAGCEAALVSARSGVPTLLLNVSLDGLAVQPCNPSVGGPGKGHLVREIDALGGEMARIADATALQGRWLNTRKGPSVRALRVQTDKDAYSLAMRRSLEKQADLRVEQGMACAIDMDDRGRIVGVRTREGRRISCRAVVVATGTFLRGKIHVGELQFPAGRAGEEASLELSPSLAALGLPLARLKTGTPPRIDAATVDFGALSAQEHLATVPPFSFLGEPRPLFPRPCWMVHTTERTHEIIRANFHRAPLYSGQIEGTGPRYCPSIEVKVRTFPEKRAHLLYLEPERRRGRELYLAGLSTSLPESVQEELVRSLPGLERARLFRPGYAIEYDHVDPTILDGSLAVRHRPGLWLAGQINGTSGYEEAAAQGLLAGLNAARWVQGLPPFHLGRDEAYLGVLVDDIVHKGVDEPYRIFTSRAEHRLLLRHDNADFRLTSRVMDFPHVSAERRERFRRRRRAVNDEIDRLRHRRLEASPELDAKLVELGSTPLGKRRSLAEILRRPEMSLHALRCLDPAEGPELPSDVADEVEVRIKYEGYIAKQRRQVETFRRLEESPIPEDFDPRCLPALSHEAREKIAMARPRSVGEAARLPGVRMSDALLLLGHLRRGKDGS